MAVDAVGVAERSAVAVAVELIDANRMGVRLFISYLPSAGEWRVEEWEQSDNRRPVCRELETLIGTLHEGHFTPNGFSPC